MFTCLKCYPDLVSIPSLGRKTSHILWDALRVCNTLSSSNRLTISAPREPTIGVTLSTGAPELGSTLCLIGVNSG